MNDETELKVINGELALLSLRVEDLMLRSPHRINLDHAHDAMAEAMAALKMAGRPAGSRDPSKPLGPADQFNPDDQGQGAA